MGPQNIERANYWVRAAGAAALGVLTLFLLVGTVGALKYVRYIGSGVSASNVISVSGHGEVFAVPDTATFTFSVREEAKQVETAQNTATDKVNEIIDFLTAQGIEEKDIQTTSYNVQPMYDWIQDTCVNGVCRGGRQTLRGFEVSQTVTVKVRDTEAAGELLSGIGSRGVSDVSGLSFTVDDEEALQEQAREAAIEEARKKAEELADQLGVDIVRVVGFSENSYGYPTPYAYGRGGVAMDSMAEAQNAKAPSLPTGENKITSDVSVTYEIR